MQSNRKHGFSLIEILIAVAIMGILAAVAIPSYSNFVTESRRTDAHIALRDAAQQMERCRTENFSYVDCDDSSRTNSPDGYYQLTYSNVAANTFTITATAVTGKSQGNDTTCTPMSINQADVTTPAACW